MTRALSALLLSAAACFAQPPAPDRLPSFEVADIKPSDPHAIGGGKGRLLPGGRIELPGGTLVTMIMAAYGVFQEDMISGLPKWAETDRFDIVAKAPENTPPATLWLMLQSLLADRFQLQIHYEEKMRQAYVLTRGKRPLKLEPSTARQTCNWTQVEGGLMRRQCQGMTMAEFTRSMPGLGGVGINRPVVDETGLNGAYDFHFAVGFANRGKGDGVRAGENPVAASAADSSEMDGPTIFTALDEIGLKLESRKMPLKTIVIDRVVRPSVN